MSPLWTYFPSVFRATPSLIGWSDQHDCLDSHHTDSTHEFPSNYLTYLVNWLNSFHPLAMSKFAGMLSGDSAGHDRQWLRGDPKLVNLEGFRQTRSVGRGYAAQWYLTRPSMLPPRCCHIGADSWLHFNSAILYKYSFNTYTIFSLDNPFKL